MKKITAKFIVNNLDALARGEHIYHRGAEYWMSCNQVIINDEVKYDISNGTIWVIDEDRKILGAVNGVEYAKIVDGVAYKA